jgi:hypothetical protein
LLSETLDFLLQLGDLLPHFVIVEVYRAKGMI